MTFTLTVTEDYSGTPRVLLEAMESDPSKPIQSCVFYRDGVALRFAASVSSSSAVAYDYDAPFDVALTYRADAVEAVTGAAWTESWADLDDWTGDGWSVGGGFATAVSAGSKIYRDLGGTLSSLDVDAASENATVELLDAAGLVVASLHVDGSAVATLTTDGGVPSGSVAGATTLTVSVSDSNVQLWVDGSLLLSAATTEPVVCTRVRLNSDASASVGELSALIAEDSTDVSATDSALIEGIDAVWLTNSASPDLAVRVSPDGSSEDGIVFSPLTRQSTTARSSSVTLDLEGAAVPLSSTLGPRKAKTWDMVLHCLSGGALDSLDSVTANNAPLGLRKPGSLAFMRVPDGFYSVGDIDTERVQTPWDNREEIDTVTLPLTPTYAPSFDVLWTWDYDASSQTGLTYDELSSVFATYDGLLIGPS